MANILPQHNEILHGQQGDVYEWCAPPARLESGSHPIRPEAFVALDIEYGLQRHDMRHAMSCQAAIHTMSCETQNAIGNKMVQATDD